MSESDAYLIGEIWDAASVVGPYLDHALDSGFNFDLAKMLVNAAKLERASTIPSVLSKTYPSSASNRTAPSSTPRS